MPFPCRARKHARMMEHQKRKLLTAILFIILGLPGLAVFMFSSFCLVLLILEPISAETLPRPSILIVGTVIGLIFVLLGSGLWRKWLYALVFLAIPVSVGMFAILDSFFRFASPKPLPELALFMGVVTFVAYNRVRSYYSKRQDREGES